jgi:hypothetical protein
MEFHLYSTELYIISALIFIQFKLEVENFIMINFFLKVFLETSFYNLLLFFKK